jgi:hypothetical protein
MAPGLWRRREYKKYTRAAQVFLRKKGGRKRRLKKRKCKIIPVDKKNSSRNTRERIKK